MSYYSNINLLGMNDIGLTIRAHVRLARKKTGMSQDKMASSLGIARQTYIDMETKTTPRADRLALIARLTNRPIGWFYGERMNAYRPETIVISGVKYLRS